MNLEQTIAENKKYKELRKYLDKPQFRNILKKIERIFIEDEKKQEELLNLLRDTHKTARKDWSEFTKIIEGDGEEILYIREAGFYTHRDTPLENFRELTRLTGRLLPKIENWGEFAKIIGHMREVPVELEFGGVHYVEKGPTGGIAGFCTHAQTPHCKFKELVQLVENMWNIASANWVGFSHVIGYMDMYRTKMGFCTHIKTSQKKFEQLVQLVEDTRETAGTSWDGLAHLVGYEDSSGTKMGFRTHAGTPSKKFEQLVQLSKSKQKAVCRQWFDFSKIIGFEGHYDADRGSRGFVGLVDTADVNKGTLIRAGFAAIVRDSRKFEEKIKWLMKKTSTFNVYPKDIGIGRGGEHARGEPRANQPLLGNDARAALKTLKLGDNASWNQIVRRYKDLAKKYHPDRYHDPEPDVANQKMTRINNAFRILVEGKRASDQK